MKRHTTLPRYIIATIFLVMASSAIAEDIHQHEEPHVVLSDAILKASGIVMRRVQASPLRITLQLPGRLTPNEERVAHMSPRFSGIIKEVRKRLGDRVEKNETLAIIESNQTVQTYELRSLVSGVITYRHATLGEFASEAAELFVVADYGELFADCAVFSPDFEKLRIGQKVLLKVSDASQTLESVISFISPIVDIETQSRFVRAVIANPQLTLQPGAYVTGEVVLSESMVPLAVERNAIQTIDGEPMVFVREGEKLVPRRVVQGATDNQNAEILTGLQAGDEYAAGNTFLLKAELSKGEAEHDH